MWKSLLSESTTSLKFILEPWTETTEVEDFYNIVSFSFTDSDVIPKSSVKSDSAIPLLWKFLSVSNSVAPRFIMAVIMKMIIFFPTSSKNESCILIRLILRSSEAEAPLFLAWCSCSKQTTMGAIISVLENH